MRGTQESYRKHHTTWYMRTWKVVAMCTYTSLLQLALEIKLEETL